MAINHECIEALIAPDGRKRTRAEQHIRTELNDKVLEWSQVSLKRMRHYEQLHHENPAEHAAAVAELAFAILFNRLRRDTTLRQQIEAGQAHPQPGKKLFKFEDEERFRKFVRRVVAFVARDYIDQLVRDMPLSDGADLPDDEWFRVLEVRYDLEDPEDIIAHQELLDNIQEFAEGLSAKDRYVFEARAYGGLTYREIAECTGDSESCGKANFRRLLGKLRRYLRSLGYDIPDPHDDKD